MMKKLLVLLLSAMMVFSLVACGGDDTTDGDDQNVESNVDADDEADANDDAEANDDTEANAGTGEVTVSEDAVYIAMGIDSLEGLPVCEMVDLTNTIWSFSGAMMEGVELTQEEYLEALTVNYAGMLEFVFDADGVAYMVYAGHTENPIAFTGQYGYSEDGSKAFLSFDINGTAYNYLCWLTQVDDTIIFMAMPEGGNATQDAMYFLLNN